MSELIIYYILPNVVLFGSIYGFSKIYEFVVWQWILKNTSISKIGH